MNLPIYNAEIKAVEDGVVVMSLVDEPATLTNWLCFNEDKPLNKFALVEDEQVLLGVVMLADTPIYRRDNSGFEYYIQYSKETLKVMAEKMLKEGTFNNISIMHNGEVIPKGIVTLRELFIKDSAKGIAPKGLEEVTDGSLLCAYKVENKDLWEQCKNGTFNGFSLEGYFTTELANKETKKYSKMSKLKDVLKKLLVEFGEISTDNGTLEFEGEEIVVGIEVKTEEGETPTDGEYTTENGTIYTIKDGVVTEVKEPTEEEVEEPTEEATEMAEEEVTEEETEEEVEVTTEPTDLELLKDQVSALKAELEALKATVEELANTPIVEPIVETFAKVNNTDIKDAKLKRMCEVAKYLRK